ncbi:Ribonuclease H [Abeliophyllum distichum]|uniref:Ribonuclease H n=1 Tax=Abeliophyllum distichum TaxID=126358 RepID=A0ABD1V461_9LAMI
MGLMQVTQDKGESLREYMSRFNRATLGIKNLQMSSVIISLFSGLRNHGFRASLSKKRGVHRPGGDPAECTFVCYTLRNKHAKIVTVVRKIEIRSFHSRPQPQKEEERKGERGVINVIIGGSVGGGDSKNPRKGYARSLHVNSIGVSSRFGQSVTFNDDDLEGVSLPHDDALVITGNIADFDVRRVLVDTGSAANVMS